MPTGFIPQNGCPPDLPGLKLSLQSAYSLHINYEVNS